jgi:hypothetical protein
MLRHVARTTPGLGSTAVSSLVRELARLRFLDWRTAAEICFAELKPHQA